MKKSSLKYVLFAAVAAVGVVAASIYSCEKEVVSPTGSEKSDYERLAVALHVPVPPSVNACGEILEKYIVGPEGQKVGKATIFNDKTNVYVTMMTVRGFIIKNASMEVCDRAGQMPLNADKNPDVSAFEYFTNGSTTSNVTRFIIPKKEMDKSSFYAIAVTLRSVRGNEKFSEDAPAGIMRAWVQGKVWGANENGRLFDYTMGICQLDSEHNIVDNIDHTELQGDHSTPDSKGVTEAGTDHNKPNAKN